MCKVQTHVFPERGNIWKHLETLNPEHPGTLRGLSMAFMRARHSATGVVFKGPISQWT